jgi:hydroxypyruvate isomerase
VPNVALQFDAYHTHMMREDVVAEFAKHQKILGHVQVSDVPGRHEPGSGEIDFEAFFTTLDARNYGGWVGCEYRPEGDTMAGLGWLKRYSACHS